MEGQVGPARMIERLAARDIARKKELLQNRRERLQRSGDQSNREILLPPLNQQLSITGGPDDVDGKAVLLLKNTPANFLENLAHVKTNIISQLDTIFDVPKDHSIPVFKRIELLDDVLSQIEDVQRWFSESSAHLKAFHTEQARLELDDLKFRFHQVREQILPKKKFTFGGKALKTARSATESDAFPKASKKTESPLKPPTSTVNTSAIAAKFSLSDQTDNACLRLPTFGEPPDSLIGQSVYLSNLERCIIYIEGVCGNLMVHNLRACTVYAQPVASSVLLQGCEDCHFVLTSRQLRVHQTRDSRLDIFVASPPIIEDSTRLKLAPYPLGAAKSERFANGLLVSGLSDFANNWCYVQDFSCPTLLQMDPSVIKTPNAVISPNWTQLPESEWNQADIPTCPENA